MSSKENQKILIANLQTIFCQTFLKTKTIQLIVDKLGEAQDNMDKDRMLFEAGNPVIRFYTWKEKAFSIGYFQSEELVRQTLAMEDVSCPIVKRITGGGVVEHGKDLTFSIVLPDSQQWGLDSVSESYRIINSIIRTALEETFLDTHISICQSSIASLKQERKTYFCFQKPTRYDLIWQGVKVAGGAQRRSKGVFLHQGSIAVPMDAKQQETFIIKILHFLNK